MLRYRDNLDEPATRKKVEKMYTGLSLKKSYWTILYYPIFILRRLAVVLCPMLIFNTSLQLIALLWMALLYTMWYAYVMPH